MRLARDSVVDEDGATAIGYGFTGADALDHVQV